MLTLTQRFIDSYPNAHAGLLVMRGAANPSFDAGLEARKRELETDLRGQFSDKDVQLLEDQPALKAYAAYYRKFDKTYHVTGQLKSVIYKEKPIPSVAALVEAMFIAELKNGLLTAGHDLDQVTLPLRLDMATGDEQYQVMRGTDQLLKPGDMYIADDRGILSSILYGPDQRTQITPQTTNVVFTVYAPEGIDSGAVTRHLQDLADLVKIIAPAAETELLKVFGA